MAHSGDENSGIFDDKTLYLLYTGHIHIITFLLLYFADVLQDNGFLTVFQRLGEVNLLIIVLILFGCFAVRTINATTELY